MQHLYTIAKKLALPTQIRFALPSHDIVETAIHERLIDISGRCPRRTWPNYLADLLAEKFHVEFLDAKDFYREPELMEIIGCSG